MDVGLSGTIFSNIISQIERGSLTPGLQFGVLNALSEILGSTPEGHESCRLIRAELETSVSRDREMAIAAHAKLQSLLPGGEPVSLQLPPPKLDYVAPATIALLKEVQPVLERAMRHSPSEEAVQAFKKLQRIAPLSGSSQTMAAVLDPARLESAREAIRRTGSPAVRYLEKIVRSERESGRITRHFLFEGRVLHRSDWSGLLKLLNAHFQSPPPGITREALEEIFLLPQKDFRVGTVSIRRDANQPLQIVGEIRTTARGVARGIGYFSLLIPSAPADGRPWVAKAEAISIHPEHKRSGLGSQLLVRAARFLKELGLEAMDANAMDDAGLFCVFNGFFADRKTYEEAVFELVQEERRKGSPIADEGVRQLLHPDANLAELAAFRIDEGRTGRDFLNELFKRKYLRLRFQLGAESPSWLRLLSNLHRNDPSPLAPLEWEALEVPTRAMLYSGVTFVGGNVPRLMSSDLDHVDHLIERLNNWAAQVSMFTSYPPSARGRMSEEARAGIEERLTAIQDLLAMLDADRSSPLGRNFRILIDPSEESGAARGRAKDHGAFVASALLSAEREALLRLPAGLKALFEDVVSRD
jgi:GNAT superfamily N-acetyltransferase